MIKKIDALLISWAEQTAGGVGVIGSCGGFGGTAITKPHKRRIVVDSCGSRVAELTVRACETRVAKRASVCVSAAALDVDRAVGALPDKLREAVEVFYKDGGLAMEVRAKKIGVSRATMYNRVGDAHVEIQKMLFGSKVAA